jgi:zinc transporter ZupT
MLTTFLQALTAFSGAAAGGALAVSVGVSHRKLCALISFAAGALLATTSMHILPEAAALLPAPALLTAFISGYALFFLISRYVTHVCPACSASHFDEHTGNEIRSTAILLAIALGIHSAFDGIAIAVGEELEYSGGISLFTTVTIHKLPEGLALCALFLKAGWSRAKSFGFTLALESTTLAGWVLGAFSLAKITDSLWFYAVLMHVGGGFIYLALHAVLNEARKHPSRFILSFFLLGVVLIGLIR